jgi:hypothetical protein
MGYSKRKIAALVSQQRGVLPDAHLNMLVWTTLSYDVGETMDLKTVLIDGIPRPLETHGTYVMNALRNEYRDVTIADEKRIFMYTHSGVGSGAFDHTEKGPDDLMPARSNEALIAPSSLLYMMSPMISVLTSSSLPRASVC